MFCRHCGGKMAENGHAFCPHCGKQNAPDEAKRSRIPRWLKWLSAIFLCVVGFLTFSALFTSDLSDPIIQELQALKGNRMTEAYYNYTSKGFRKSVSLDTFRQFVQEYPFLTKQKSVTFIERNVTGNHGELRALLLSDSGEQTVIDFRLIKEEEAWKIAGIALELKGDQSVAEGDEKSSGVDPFDVTPIYTTIREQMEKIRRRNIFDAYYTYTGKEFQNSTSYAAFEQFIKSQPGLKDNAHIDLNHLTFDNNIAEVKGYLTSKEGMTYPVEYNLSFESNAWKINYVHLSPKTAEESENEYEGPITLRL